MGARFVGDHLSIDLAFLRVLHFVFDEAVHLRRIPIGDRREVADTGTSDRANLYLSFNRVKCSSRNVLKKRLDIEVSIC